jgi:Nif-specific regulatory protein
VLQDRDFERVGGTRPIPIDVRVVAATNRDLEAMVEQNRFRSDLYYRAKVVELRLPPLRERGPEDIGRLVRHFVAEAARKHGRPVPAVPPATLSRLTSYPWPGNVRVPAGFASCGNPAASVFAGARVALRGNGFRG